MGNQMKTFGGIVAFNDYSPESVRLVAEQLHTSGYYENALYRHRYNLDSSNTWTEAFSAMKQILHPIERGLYSITGLDFDFYDPKPFFEAASDFIVPGSWMAYMHDYTDDVLVLYKPFGSGVQMRKIRQESTPIARASSRIKHNYANDLLKANGFVTLEPVSNYPDWMTDISTASASSGSNHR